MSDTNQHFSQAEVNHAIDICPNIPTFLVDYDDRPPHWFPAVGMYNYARISPPGCKIARLYSVFRFCLQKPIPLILGSV